MANEGGAPATHVNTGLQIEEFLELVAKTSNKNNSHSSMFPGMLFSIKTA